jgi:hypothetical protein
MQNPVSLPRWTRHFVYPSTRLRTTWTFRLGFFILVAGVAWSTSGWWSVAVAQSLACQANRAASDAIVIENFEADNYLVFERAGDLRRAGLASRVIVPLTRQSAVPAPNAIALGTATLIAEAARTGPFDVALFDEVEPITLNAARDVLRFAQASGVKSVIVVAPYFRSKRSALVYAATFGRAGIRVTCDPVEGSPGRDTWTGTWHGLQNVVEQWLKLQYYRFYVLPFHADPGTG